MCVKVQVCVNAAATDTIVTVSLFLNVNMLIAFLPFTYSLPGLLRLELSYSAGNLRVTSLILLL